MRVTNYLADPVEIGLLHMKTGDSKRTHRGVFGNPEFWVDRAGRPPAAPRPSPASSRRRRLEPRRRLAADQHDLARLAGPGVEDQGVDNATWSSHTDIQPTMMALLRLHDDYTPDGRVLAEIVRPGALPKAMRIDYLALLVKLGDSFTRINAAVGAFGLDTLKASTRALASDSPKDATYTKIESELSKLGGERGRDRLADEGRTVRRRVRRRAVAGRRERGLVRRAGQRRQRPARPGVRAGRVAASVVGRRAGRAAPPPPVPGSSRWESPAPSRNRH